MILVDTSVWVDHLRSEDSSLASLLRAGRVLAHPFVVGELALGHLKQRQLILASLHELPQANVATDREVFYFIEQKALMGLGIGFVDVHLLAATQLTAGSTFWTRDKRLSFVAGQLGLASQFIN